MRRRTSTLLFPTILFVFGAVLGACEAEDDRFEILTVAPELVQQGKALRLDGVGFGEPVIGVSGVSIGNTCAAILHWDSQTVVVEVPPGIGTGVKQVTLARGNTRRATTTVTVIGTNYAPRPSGSVLCGVVIGIDPTMDVVEDMGDTGDDEPKDTPDDGIDFRYPPEVMGGPLCESQIAPDGACLRPPDCRLQIDARRRVWQAAEACGLDCLSTSEPALCNQDCMSENSGLTEGCSTCWTYLLTCAYSTCRSQCVDDPDQVNCSRCIEMNCVTEYEVCAGTYWTRP